MMKHAKKLASLLLALVMAMALAVPAFAAGETGSITINPPTGGTDITYTIYKIFDLESYDTEGHYSYTVADDWKSFITGDGASYVTVTNGYVTWKTVDDEGNPEGAAEFAKAALAYAHEKKIANQGQEKASTTKVTFTGLELGYYLVDSSVGVLCALTTTKPTETITDKHSLPQNEKTVEEDSTCSYGSTNDADIGQTVNFKSTITANKGAESYVFHDKMSEGLTYGSVTGITLNATPVDNTDEKAYTVKTSELGDECTFHVVFTQAFCDTLENNDKIVIAYAATVNGNAVVGDTGNENESKLTYGEEGQFTTTPSTTTTYTWSFDVLKYGNGDETKVLSGAKFVLLNSDKSKAATIVNGKLTGWIEVANGTELTTSNEGKIEISGLDADTYYLRETEAPAGFNKLADDVKVEIKPTADQDGKTLTLAPVTAKVENKSGSELPGTGGMGTTIFYVLGGALMLGAVVLLITKKRMGQTGK